MLLLVKRADEKIFSALIHRRINLDIIAHLFLSVSILYRQENTYEMYLNLVPYG